jgi:hypothetical protein
MINQFEKMPGYSGIVMCKGCERIVGEADTEHHQCSNKKLNRALFIYELMRDIQKQANIFHQNGYGEDEHLNIHSCTCWNQAAALVAGKLDAELAMYLEHGLNAELEGTESTVETGGEG